MTMTFNSNGTKSRQGSICVTETEEPPKRSTNSSSDKQFAMKIVANYITLEKNMKWKGVVIKENDKDEGGYYFQEIFPLANYPK